MTDAGDEPLIHTRGLGFIFDGKAILRDVNFELRAGEAAGLIGPPQSGKSTLLHICLGRLRPTSGDVFVFGAPPSELRERRAWIGYIPQKPHRDYPLETTALDFVADGAMPPGRALRRAPDLMATAAEVLELAGAGDLAQRAIGSLDLVRFCRIRLARGLVNRPKMLIVDQLGAALMAVDRTALYKRILQARDAFDLALLIVESDIDPVRGIVPQIVCLRGTIHYRGAPEDITQDEVMRAYNF